MFTMSFLGSNNSTKSLKDFFSYKPCYFFVYDNILPRCGNGWVANNVYRLSLACQYAILITHTAEADRNVFRKYLQLLVV